MYAIFSLNEVYFMKLKLVLTLLLSLGIIAPAAAQTAEAQPVVFVQKQTEPSSSESTACSFAKIVCGCTVLGLVAVGYYHWATSSSLAEKISAINSLKAEHDYYATWYERTTSGSGVEKYTWTMVQTLREKIILITKSI